MSGIIKALKPLIANLKMINFKAFLSMDHFYNIMLENDYDDDWVRSVENAVQEDDSYEGAFIYMLESFYMTDDDRFFELLSVCVHALIELKSPEQDLSKIISCLNQLEMPTDLLNKIINADKAVTDKLNPPGYDNIVLNKKDYIFIGHGGSLLWREVKDFIKDENFECEAFESNVNTGYHIIDILNKHLDQATFAIIIVTAEDKQEDGKIRARQNVVHEIGLFQGRLGFNKVAILKQEEAEAFTNNDGLQHIPFNGNKIRQAFHDLKLVLKREGVKTK